jgi:hypothetical protein
MYEDRPEKDTPEWLQAELREYGGLSPDGQPIWRMVLARNCRIRCFGTMNHGTAYKVPESPKKDEWLDELKALTGRVEEGEFWVPRYKIDGWILQRWFPASHWGSREKWESEKARDGRTRLLAAYPQRGDYMMMPCGPWNTIAEAGDLKAAIRCYNAQQRRNPANWENHERAMLAFETQENQQQVNDYAEEIAAQHREVLAGTLRSVSESAQRFRNVVAKHTAGGVNLGASEKWG